MQTSIKQLEEVRAERKIMIILTDGSSDTHSMNKAFAEATKKGIEPIGITIGGNDGIMKAVFGKNNIAIDNTGDSEEIAKAFIDILKSTIKKSNT